MARKLSDGEVPAPPPPTKRRVVSIPSSATMSTESLERDAQAMRLRAAGWTVAAIAAEMGCEAATVSHRINRHVSSIVDEPAKAVREQMLARLDNAVNRTMQALNATHLKFHQGEPVYIKGDDGKTDVPVVDWGPVLAAADRVESLDARRAKLLGIDAPERAEVSITQLPEHVTAWVAERKAAAIAATQRKGDDSAV